MPSNFIKLEYDEILDFLGFEVCSMSPLYKFLYISLGFFKFIAFSFTNFSFAFFDSYLHLNYYTTLFTLRVFPIPGTPAMSIISHELHRLSLA